MVRATTSAHQKLVGWQILENENWIRCRREGVAGGLAAGECRQVWESAKLLQIIRLQVDHAVDAARK